MLFMKNKKGQAINMVSGTVLGFLTLIFIIFAVLFAISILNPAGFFTDATNGNATAALTGNLTKGVSDFGSYIPSVFKILAVVVILAGLLLLVFYILRMRGGSGAGGL